MLGVALVTAIVVGVLIATLPSEEVLVGFAGVVSFLLISFLISRSDTTCVLLAATIFTTAISTTFWLDHRISIGEFPISVPDVIVFAYGLFALTKWFRDGHARMNTIGALLSAWLLYNSFFGVGIGMRAGNPMYAVLQEYRVVLYAAVAYFATLVLFQKERHLRAVMLSLVGAGLTVSIWQLAISVSGLGLRLEEMVSVNQNSLGRQLRDVNLPLYFAALALIMLVMILEHAPTFLGKKQWYAWALVPVFLVAVIVSNTRAVWVSLAVSICVLLLHSFILNLSKRSLWRQMVLAGACIVSGVFAYIVLRMFLPTMSEAALTAWDYTLSDNDSTSFTRLEIVQTLLKSFWDDVPALLSGIGFGNMWSGAIREGPYTNLHNTYLAYMVIGGLPGLMLFLALWISPLVSCFRLLRRALSPIVKAYVLASIMSWVVFSALLLSIPPHWSEAAFFGITLGILTVLEDPKRYGGVVVN